MKIAKLLTVAASMATASLVFSSTANAALVLNDGFESDPAGLTVTSLTNFNVVGNVDVVNAVNPYSIVVSSPASGKVVDLDGTTGPGKIVSKLSYAFAANDQVTLSFVLGGSQRNGGFNNIQVGFIFNAITNVLNFTQSGPFGFGPYSGFLSPGYAAGTSINSTFPFTTITFSFTAVNPGTLGFSIETFSADNVGPLIDNVKLDITSVPEPSTLVLMVASMLALLGLGMRRRTRHLA